MKMFGPDGKETAKTALGQQYGSRFDHAVDESDKASKGSGSINAQGRYDPEDGDRIPGRFLPSPKDMFQMDQNGLYRLEIEFQLNGPHKDTNQGGLELLRFPPLEIAVEKPLTAPFFVFSATNQGVYISIIGTKSNGLTGFDDGLQWRVFCESQYSMLHSLDLPSGFKMNLTGPDGKEVPKIGPGKTIGVNFEAVKTMEKLPPGAIASELNFTSGIGDIVGANPLQRIEDCFAMDKPGIYTLELQIQLFRNKYSAAGEPGPEELLRFPPMTIKLNRP